MAKQSRDTSAKKRAIAQQLPDPTQILRASLIERYTICGKPGCTCMRGHKHGPFYVISVTIAAGKTRQVYVRKDDLATVKRWIENYHRLWEGLMAISDSNFEALRTKKPAPSTR